MVVYTIDFLFLQIFTLNMTITAQLIIVGHFAVMKKKSLNQAEFINESVMLLIMYCAFVFCDFLDDAKTKFQLGYVFSGIILAHLVVNIFFIFRRSIRAVKRKMKLRSAFKKANAIVVKR